VGVAPHLPGQYISVRVNLPDQSVDQVRNYTVSDTSNGLSYRISVKRDGAVSGWLHTQLGIGEEIELRDARGAFTFDAASRRPVVLISAGVGVTPMIAMLNSLLVNGDRTLYPHPIYFIHAARNRSEHAFMEHVRELAARHWNLSVHVRYSGAAAVVDDDDEVARYHIDAGRVDINFLKEVLPFDDYDFYLCGPGTFMQSLSKDLLAMNIAPARIRQEAFGPSARPATPERHDALTCPEDIAVKFTRSNQRVMWNKSKGSLLECAESLGIVAESGCRTGMCGACAVSLQKGSVQYIRPCDFPVEKNQVLICSAIPAVIQPGDGIEMEIEIEL
jgi:uncharacterized protein